MHTMDEGVRVFVEQVCSVVQTASPNNLTPKELGPPIDRVLQMLLVTSLSRLLEVC